MGPGIMTARIDPLTVTCPECNASVGKPCRNYGWAKGVPHYPRRQKAARRPHLTRIGEAAKGAPRP